MAGNKHWTSEQVEYLDRNYRNNDIEDLKKNIGRSADAIRWKAAKMGLLLRDGRKFNGLKKITVSVTPEHYEYLKAHSFNQSDVIRKALEVYIKTNKK